MMIRVTPSPNPLRCFTSRYFVWQQVAAAVQNWATDRGATVYTHWFQPLGATEVRLGMSGQVQNAMFAFGKDGKAKFSEFGGKELLKGETDGSSYPNGGMRATNTAGGYTVLDPTSPIFMRGDTVSILLAPC